MSDSKIRGGSEVMGRDVSEVLVPYPRAFADGDYALLPGDLGVLLVTTQNPETEFFGPSGWTRASREQFYRVLDGHESWPLRVSFVSRATVFAGLAVVDADSIPRLSEERAFGAVGRIR